MGLPHGSQFTLRFVRLASNDTDRPKRGDERCVTLMSQTTGQGHPWSCGIYTWERRFIYLLTRYSKQCRTQVRAQVGIRRKRPEY